MGKHYKGGKKRKHGGTAANPSSYSSAATYALQTVGPEQVQYSNVFDITPGSNNSNSSNAIRGLQGQIAGSRKRKHNKSKKSKKGGLWGQVLNQAIVPFSLLGLQNLYKKRQMTNRYKNKNSRFTKKRRYI